MGGRDLARFEFMMNFGRVTYIASHSRQAVDKSEYAGGLKRDS